MITVTLADVLKHIKTIPDNHYHLVFADPPYHLTEMTKRFGKKTSKPAKRGKDGAFARAGAGFMGMPWDGGDVAHNPKTWKEFMRVTMPGGFMVMYGSARGYHRMACAMEDAGWILHPDVFCWVNGQGMPKPTRMDKRIDAKAGVEQPVVQVKKHTAKMPTVAMEYRGEQNGFNTVDRKTFNVTEPVTDMAKLWAEYRYGLGAIAPKVEPVIIAQKPYEGDPLTSIVRTGAGAYNIGGTMVDNGRKTKINRHKGGAHPWGDAVGVEYDQVATDRFWTKNFMLCHTPDCSDAQCMPQCPVRTFKTQAGEKRADFFSQFWFDYEAYERLGMANSAFYAAKPTKEEREAGLESFAAVTVDDGRKTPIDNPMLRGETERLNPHPTIKPMSMDIEFATLFLPPDHEAYYPRRAFNPFSGSGTEAIALHLAGWDVVDCVEITPKYIPILEARAAFWQSHGRDALVKRREIKTAKTKTKAKPKPTKTTPKKSDKNQLTLF